MSVLTGSLPLKNSKNVTSRLKNVTLAGSNDDELEKENIILM